MDCIGFYNVRRLDGTCNNLRNATTTNWGTCTNCTNWGASAIKMRRMAGTAYSDQLQHKPREVESEKNSWGKYILPKANVSPRVVSTAMHKSPLEQKLSEKGFTHMSMQFGQFLDHDITLTPEGGYPSQFYISHLKVTILIISSSRVAVL